MGLIHDLRGIPAPKQKHSKEDNGYNPLFLTAIKKRGYFLMSEETYDLEAMECVRKTGKVFQQWLKDNKLRIIASEIKDHYKIYY